MSMDSLNAFATLDYQRTHCSESAESSVLERVLQLPDECQRNILERYFYEHHVPMFRYNGWGNIVPIPETNQIRVLSPFMTNAELIYLKHLVRLYREAHIIFHCQDIIIHFPLGNHTIEELTAIFNPVCKTLLCHLLPFRETIEGDTLVSIINLVVSYPTLSLEWIIRHDNIKLLGQWYDDDTGSLATKTIEHHYSYHYLFIFHNSTMPRGIHLIADIGRWYILDG